MLFQSRNLSLDLRSLARGEHGRNSVRQILQSSLWSALQTDGGGGRVATHYSEQKEILACPECLALCSKFINVLMQGISELK
jgi:hypothetical protein